MGSHIIILNSIKSATELLDKRASIYSDRYERYWSVRDNIDPSQTTLRPPLKALALYENVLWVSLTLYIDHRFFRFGMDFNLGFVHYGPPWRRSRRGLHESFRPADLQSYKPLQQRAVHHLLRNFLSSPDNFGQHFRQ